MRHYCCGVAKLIGLTYIPSIIIHCLTVTADTTHFNNNYNNVDKLLVDYADHTSMLLRPFHPIGGLEAYADRYEKRALANNADNNGQREIRSPLGTMRFGKRTMANPLGTMRFGKRAGFDAFDGAASPLGTMRFGKRAYNNSPLGTMRFGKRADGDVNSPLGTMRFGKRGVAVYT